MAKRSQKAHELYLKFLLPYRYAHVRVHFAFESYIHIYQERPHSPPITNDNASRWSANGDSDSMGCSLRHIHNELSGTQEVKETQLPSTEKVSVSAFGTNSSVDNDLATCRQIQTMSIS